MAQYRRCQGAIPPTEPEPRDQPHGPRPDLKGDSVMSRYKGLALRLAVVASFVLVLAAPLRW